MTNLLVMKFGGTSMGSAERIRVAAQICTEQKKTAAHGSGGFGDVGGDRSSAEHSASCRSRR